MAKLRIEKVTQLPEVLSQNTLYLVRVSQSRFRIYFTEDNENPKAIEYKMRDTLYNPLCTYDIGDTYFPIIYTGEVTNFNLTSYDPRKNYVITTSEPSIVVTRNESAVAFDVPDDPDIAGPIEISVNGSIGYYLLFAIRPERPTILFPSNGATEVEYTNFVVVTSDMVMNSPTTVDTHISSDIEIATDPEFTNLVYSSYDDPANTTGFVIP